MNTRNILLLLILPLVLAACGFHLRNSQELPFKTLYIALAESNDLRATLTRGIHASTSTRVVDYTEKPEATFTVLGDTQQKIILSLDASGVVREYQLQRIFIFRLADAQGRELIPQGRIEMHRDVTSSPDQVLSKQAEETLLWRDMQNDLVQQVLRRLATAKPPKENAAADGN